MLRYTSTFTFVSSESFKVHFTKLILTVWQSILTCTINTQIINELPTHVYTQAGQNVCSHSFYIRNTYSPQKLFTFNNSMCVHWTRNFRFTKPWHIKPPYITLFNKKKLPLRLCNTQNKCVHIYSISVTWWQQVIGFDIADGSISMMSHLLNYTWERCFLPWSWETYVIGWWQFVLHCSSQIVIWSTKQRFSILFELSNFYHFICLWREKENWELVL